MITFLVQVPFYIVFAWFAIVCMGFAQRAVHARDHYKARFEELARERARVRVACRDVIEWFETQHPIGEVYALGFLAFDDLRSALAPPTTESSA